MHGGARRSCCSCAWLSVGLMFGMPMSHLKLEAHACVRYTAGAEGGTPGAYSHTLVGGVDACRLRGFDFARRMPMHQSTKVQLPSFRRQRQAQQQQLARLRLLLRRGWTLAWRVWAWMQMPATSRFKRRSLARSASQHTMGRSL